MNKNKKNNCTAALKTSKMNKTKRRTWLTISHFNKPSTPP
nr:MAG TPA: hypothetical protein [Caudoviricetes sp.]